MQSTSSQCRCLTRRRLRMRVVESFRRGGGEMALRRHHFDFPLERIIVHNRVDDFAKNGV